MPWDATDTSVVVSTAGAVATAIAAWAAWRAADASRQQVALAHQPTIVPEAPANMIWVSDFDGRKVPPNTNAAHRVCEVRFSNAGTGPAIDVTCDYSMAVDTPMWQQARVGTSLRAGYDTTCRLPEVVMAEGDRGRFWLRWRYASIAGEAVETVARHRPGGGFDINPQSESG